MKHATRFKPGTSGNPDTKWRPGQSGNPAGKSKVRLQFEENFNQALISQGSPEEAAQLLWEAARKGEAWAIQELCRRFSPEPHSLRLIHEADNDEPDYSKLTDQELEQLEAILRGAQAQPDTRPGGTSQTQVP
jgi:hypothetical protein